MKMWIAGTECSLNYRSYEIYVQGCYRNCHGCHNPQTQPFCLKGTEVCAEDFLKEQKEKTNKFDALIERIYVTGGDILCSPFVAEDFTKLVRQTWKDKDLWLFTGEDCDNLPSWVWQYYDVIKCGKYDEKQLNPRGTFPASKNQVLIVNKDLVGNKDVLRDVDFKGKIGVMRYGKIEFKTY